MLALYRLGIFPITATHESILVIPERIQFGGIDTEETTSVNVRRWYCDTRLGIDKLSHTFRIAVVQFLEPFWSNRVIVIIAEC